MIRILLLLAATLSALVPGGGARAGDTVAYKCLVEKARADGWIQPLIFIAHDRNDGRVVVSDAVILHFNDGQPVPARVAKDNGRRTTFAWEVRAVLGRSPVVIQYRGTYMKADRRFAVSATMPGNETAYHALGTCQVDRLAS
ncbi:hypothetical protein [Sagittula salina]|uniref:Uncharacterized protein n=1 Tax=Sagittula salina TaxID=2820268 RepID=A0A940MLP8_9RHOB|nr:hypothetical protein [Sagittula salina]MBP0481659.1 hypothetical protein [Sagittula salina]